MLSAVTSHSEIAAGKHTPASLPCWSRACDDSAKHCETFFFLHLLRLSRPHSHLLRQFNSAIHGFVARNGLATLPEALRVKYVAEALALSMGGADADLPEELRLKLRDLAS